jgi:hypothetical protein
MGHELLFGSQEEPFGHIWSEWVAIWCRWMLSIPKQYNPSLDETGKYCCINQNIKEVWFLTGTFGNLIPVVRKCRVPSGRAILFPILEKEDSLAEDSDLLSDSELARRCKDAIDRVIHIEVSIDDRKIEDLGIYRFQSSVFDLTFPEGNVYDVKPGPTRSVCDGYWVFIKPLSIGPHVVHFKGENLLAEPHTANQLKSTEVFSPIRKHVLENSTFKLDVKYELTVVAD